MEEAMVVNHRPISFSVDKEILLDLNSKLKAVGDVLLSFIPTESDIAEARKSLTPVYTMLANALTSLDTESGLKYEADAMSGLTYSVNMVFGYVRLDLVMFAVGEEGPQYHQLTVLISNKDRQLVHARLRQNNEDDAEYIKHLQSVLQGL